MLCTVKLVHQTYIAALICGNSFKWKLIERDEELISMLIELEKKFWENVKNGTPPPVDGYDACADFLAKKFFGEYQNANRLAG